MAAQCRLEAKPKLSAPTAMVVRSVAVNSASVMSATVARDTPPQLTPPACAHCGLPLAGGQKQFCCGGCASVFTLLTSQGLERYYDLRDSDSSPAITVAAPSDLPMAHNGKLSLGVQGLHCTACVWLCEELFRREPGGVSIEVRVASGQLELQVSDDFALAHYAETLAAFGYRLGAPHLAGAPPSRQLLFRIGACAALALNSMAISFAFYFGLDAHEHLLYVTLGIVSCALATLAVAIGGTVFLRSALASVRERVLHLDVPIALGVVVAYGASLAAYVLRGPELAYFDSVTGFITLMLIGKYLPQRMLEWNAAQLLGDRTFDGLRQRRRNGTGVERVPVAAIAAGDFLLMAPGDLATVDIMLEQPGVFRLDWLTGESESVEFAVGALLPAGAFNAGVRTAGGRALSDGNQSSLNALLPSPKKLGDTSHDRFVPSFARAYVVSILLVAAAVFAFWISRDVDKALSATVAVLVVSCPCAIGLATPLAYEVIVSRLRRRGIFLHSASALDRLADVHTIAFDKTGTLTGDALELAGEPPALAPLDHSALAAMVAVSNHPQARAIAARLPLTVHSGALIVEEHAGTGLFAGSAQGEAYFLGRDQDGSTVFSRDGNTLARFAFREAPLDDAHTELQALRQRGYTIALLSGDHHARVQAMATRLDLPLACAHSQMSPQEKVQWIESAERVLMVGDGLNDVRAFSAALVSAAPGTDRPCVPARADFHYTGSHLAPIARALGAARGFRRIVIGNYSFAFVYNALVLTLAAGAHMTPMIAAVLMPASSVVIVGLNAFAARRVA